MNPTYKRRAIKTAGIAGGLLTSLFNPLSQTLGTPELVDSFLAASSIMSSFILSEYLTPEKTAIHEAGHAIVAINFDDNMLMTDACIERNPFRILTTMIGGSVSIDLVFSDLNDEEKFNHIVVGMAGKAAEKLKFGKHHKPIGHGNDYRVSKKLAQELLGKSTSKSGVNNIIIEATQKAEEILKANIKDLELLSNALLEHGSLDRKAIFKLLNRADPHSDDCNFQDIIREPIKL